MNKTISDTTLRKATRVLVKDAKAIVKKWTELGDVDIDLVAFRYGYIKPNSWHASLYTLASEYTNYTAEHGYERVFLVIDTYGLIHPTNGVSSCKLHIVGSMFDMNDLTPVLTHEF